MDVRNFFVDHLIIDTNDAHSLEKRTVQQSECTEWLNEHKVRLTASSFGKVYFRVQRPSDAMMKNIFLSKDLSNVKAIVHGKLKESAARSIYAKKMQKRYPGFLVFDSGLWIPLSLPYLGASPDGKVFDPAATDNLYGLLEIKCPFTKRAETLEQAAMDPGFYLEKVRDTFHLKREHSCGYFCQMQGQLAITGLQWCDFCIYLSSSNEMFVERIYFDADYWSNQLLPKLSDFCMKHALPFFLVRQA